MVVGGGENVLLLLPIPIDLIASTHSAAVIIPLPLEKRSKICPVKKSSSGVHVVPTPRGKLWFGGAVGAALLFFHPPQPLASFLSYSSCSFSPSSISSISFLFSPLSPRPCGRVYCTKERKRDLDNLRHPPNVLANVYFQTRVSFNAQHNLIHNV